MAPGFWLTNSFMSLESGLVRVRARVRARVRVRVRVGVRVRVSVWVRANPGPNPNQSALEAHEGVCQPEPRSHGTRPARLAPAGKPPWREPWCRAVRVLPLSGTVYIYGI